MQNKLLMRYPASSWIARWREGLPAGNGRIGALVYGAVWQETVLLNHEDLWGGKTRQEMPDVSSTLPEMQKLLLGGKVEEAQSIMIDALKSRGFRHTTASPVPLGDLRIAMGVRQGFADYLRVLDMESGEIEVGWREGAARFQRSLFVSRTDDLVAMRISTDGSEGIDAELWLELHNPDDAHKPFGMSSAPLPTDAVSSSRSAFLFYAARNDDGQDFGAVGRLMHEGGSLVPTARGLRVRGAREVTVLVRLFVMSPRESAWAELERGLAAVNESYEELLTRHAAVHGELFRSVELDLGAGAAERALSNEELLLEAYRGAAPTALVEKLWSYGRYLLISSSRETGQPCPLLGLWHGDYRAFWAFNMLNENLQMIYWQALSGNMPELLLAVFGYFESMMDQFRENARKLYGCRGILIPAVSTPGEGLMQCLAPHIVAWTGGAGWLAQHYYDYWLHTQDRRFLAERALPFLREVALFYEDFFVVGEDGCYLSVPSVSPENTPGNWLPEGEADGIKTAINATMDFAIAREVLRNLIEGARLTGAYPEDLPRWEAMLARIPAYQLNEDGAVREWMHPAFSDNYHHRHQSHIYPLFPGVEVTPEEQPELFQAFERAIKKRLVIGLTSQTSWSLDHMACVYARMREGELALECLDLISRSCLMNNLFTVHNDWRGMGVGMEFKYAPFQIDATWGGPRRCTRCSSSPSRGSSASSRPCPRGGDGGRSPACCAGVAPSWTSSGTRIAAPWSQSCAPAPRRRSGSRCQRVPETSGSTARLGFAPRRQRWRASPWLRVWRSGSRPPWLPAADLDHPKAILVVLRSLSTPHLTLGRRPRARSYGP
jgi:alpha-L-fucosidase 2